jgi:MinD superfamily P-loop ATPase
MRPIVLVDAEKCQTCQRCPARVVCRPRAIVQLETGDLPIIETHRCLGCQVCVPACRFGAIGPARGQPASSPII